MSESPSGDKSTPKVRSTIKLRNKIGSSVSFRQQENEIEENKESMQAEGFADPFEGVPDEVAEPPSATLPQSTKVRTMLKLKLEKKKSNVEDLGCLNRVATEPSVASRNDLFAASVSLYQSFADPFSTFERIQRKKKGKREEFQFSNKPLYDYMKKSFKKENQRKFITIEQFGFNSQDREQVLVEPLLKDIRQSKAAQALQGSEMTVTEFWSKRQMLETAKVGNFQTDKGRLMRFNSVQATKKKGAGVQVAATPLPIATEKGEHFRRQFRMLDFKSQLKTQKKQDEELAVLKAEENEARKRLVRKTSMPLHNQLLNNGLAATSSMVAQSGFLARQTKSFLIHNILEQKNSLLHRGSYLDVSPRKDSTSIMDNSPFNRFASAPLITDELALHTKPLLTEPRSPQQHLTIGKDSSQSARINKSSSFLKSTPNLKVKPGLTQFSATATTSNKAFLPNLADQTTQPTPKQANILNLAARAPRTSTSIPTEPNSGKLYEKFSELQEKCRG